MTAKASTSQISGYSLRDTVSVSVQTKGAQLSVRDSGGDGEPIIFLSRDPGMPDYLEEIAKLVPGRRVVTYDQRGTDVSTVTDGDTLRGVPAGIRALEAGEVRSKIVIKVGGAR